MKNLRNSLLIIFTLLAFGETAWAQQSGEHELLFTDYYGSYYRFYYTSTDAAGKPVTLSSLLTFQKPNEMTSNDVNNSVLINSHYTITADAQCPSNIQEDYDMDYPDHLVLTLLFSGNSSNYNDLVSKSVVIMPDYEGYGVSANRTHLYLAEELTAKQVVDGAVSGLQLSRFPRCPS